MRALSAFAPGSALPSLAQRRLRAVAVPLCTAAAPKRVLFLGTPSVAATTLSTLVVRLPSVGAEVVGVVTRAPAAAGRRRTVQRSPVHDAALAHGVGAVLTPASARDAGFLSAVEALAPDLCVTAAYGQLLPARFLAAPALGTLNIHPSLLPAFRGAAPVPRALAAGVAATGVSVAFTVLAMDAGPVVAQRALPLAGDERAPELLDKLFRAGTDELLRVLPAVWDGSVARTLQDEAAVSQAPKLSKAEARLTFVENARIVHNKVRAFAGWPGIWADFELGDDGSLLGVSVVQPPGKREMSARAFWNGVRGKRLGRKRVPH